MMSKSCLFLLKNKLYLSLLRALIFLTIFASAHSSAAAFFGQDGLGNSNITIDAQPISENITMHGYADFPSGAGEFGKFSGGVFDGQYIWMIPMNSRVVVRLNPSNGSMASYSDWPAGFNGNEEYKFRSGVHDGQGNIWMIPFGASSVIKFDTASGAMTAYNNWPNGIASNTSKFVGGVFHNGGLFMVPCGANAVVRLDAATGAMTTYDSWPAGLMLDGLTFFGGVKDGENLWMIPNLANMVVKMNLATGEMTGYGGFPAGIGAYDREKFCGGVPDGSGGLWMIPNHATSLVKVNMTSGVMTGYSAFPEGVTASRQNKFGGGSFDGRDIWLSPMSGSSLVRVDPASGTMTGYTNFPDGYSALATTKSAGSVFDGSNLWLIPYSANRVVQVSNATGPTTNPNPNPGTNPPVWPTNPLPNKPNIPSIPEALNPLPGRPSQPAPPPAFPDNPGSPAPVVTGEPEQNRGNSDQPTDVDFAAQTVAPNKNSDSNMVVVKGVQEKVPAEHVDQETNQKLVTYTLTTIAYNDVAPGFDFRIVDKPSQQLRFKSGVIPAFTGGAGLTYTILYKTDAGAYRVLVEGILASAPYNFDSPEGVQMTEIVLFFANITPGFGQGDRILYTFEVLDDGYSNAYNVLWHKQQLDLISKDSLAHKISLLKRLLSSVADPETLAEINHVLTYASEILNDPYATESQIYQAITDIDAVLANNSTSEKAAPFSACGAGWPFIVSAAAVSLIIILWNKRKRRADKSTTAAASAEHK